MRIFISSNCFPIYFVILNKRNMYSETVFSLWSHHLLQQNDAMADLFQSKQRAID